MFVIAANYSLHTTPMAYSEPPAPANIHPTLQPYNLTLNTLPSPLPTSSEAYSEDMLTCHHAPTPASQHLRPRHVTNLANGTQDGRRAVRAVPQFVPGAERGFRQNLPAGPTPLLIVGPETIG